MAYQFRTDDTLRITSWGDSIAGLTGKSSSDVLGKKYSEVFPRIFRKDEDALLTALKKKRRITLNGHNLVCLFGTMKAEVTIRPVIKHGAVTAIEVMVVPASFCPMAERLKEMQRFVDIGKIASTLAHGVRNPLNAIKGSVVYLRDKYPKEPPLVEFTRIIEYEIHRLDTFISRFLSTSVLEAELNETDVNALMERIKVVTSFQAESSHIKVIYEMGDVPSIKANAFQVEQAVLNVMNNALRAMSSGGQLRVRTLVEKREDADFAVIEISDTGPGIADNSVGLITPKNSDGKGFGLFITHEILKYHGGHLEVKSKKGEGTTMRLLLPLA